jgi:ribosome-associated protein
MTNSENLDSNFDPDWISKTRVKNAMHDLQALGEKLCLLPKKKRLHLPVSELTQAAFEEYDRIKSKEAKRRHIQYIGKLMRNEEVEKLQRHLDILDPCSDLQNQMSKQAESWRSRLLNSNDTMALTDFIEHYPCVNAQLLRQLCRNSLAETKKTEPAEHTQEGNAAYQTKSGKKLFKLIREAILLSLKTSE